MARVHPDLEAAAQALQAEALKPSPRSSSSERREAPDWTAPMFDAVDAEMGRVTKAAHKRRLEWLAARHRLSPAALFVRLVESECAGLGKV
jgi:hypothetical protein